jgi:hypothetical protein
LYFDAQTSSSMVTAEFNAVGNWWGTQDAGLIEDRVYHGPDSSGFFTANLSSPLADEILFDVSQADNKITLTAAPLTGFVPYAGDLTIAVTVDGVAANNVAVASDYGSLSFDNDFSGEVEICVTNPGGQSGCDTLSVVGFEFEASSSGTEILLTAGEGSAFAESALIEVTVDGVVEDDVTVAEDSMSLTFPKAGYSGDVTICVTIPDGQTGCTTLSVPSSSGGGGGGCGIIPVTGPPTAKHLIEQYLLMLLPVLFFFRRRSRGHVATPTGFAAA